MIELENIIMIVTFFVTMICGIIAKKVSWFNDKLIPLQNLAIGIIAGIVYYIMVQDINLVIVAVGLGAGGTYDIASNLNKIFAKNEEVKQMKEVMRGDSWNFMLTLKNENGEVVKLKKGDVVRFGVKEYIDASKHYIIYREIVIVNDCDAVQISFTPQEMAELPVGEAVMEIELTYNGGASRKTFAQDKFIVKGDVIA